MDLSIHSQILSWDSNHWRSFFISFQNNLMDFYLRWKCLGLDESWWELLQYNCSTMENRIQREGSPLHRWWLWVVVQWGCWPPDGAGGDNDNKMARIYWNIGLWYQPITEREGETEGDLNREETELSSCQPLGEVEQQQTRQMCDSSSTANGVYLVLTIYPWPKIG